MFVSVIDKHVCTRKRRDLSHLLTHEPRGGGEGERDEGEEEMRDATTKELMQYADDDCELIACTLHTSGCSGQSGGQMRTRAIVSLPLKSHDYCTLFMGKQLLFDLSA